MADAAVLKAMRRISFNRALMDAPSPIAVLASISPVPITQKAWLAKKCGDLSDALAKLPEGRANG